MRIRANSRTLTLALVLMMAAMVFVVACSAGDEAGPGVEPGPGLGGEGPAGPDEGTPADDVDAGDDQARSSEPVSDQEDDDGALLAAPDQNDQVQRDELFEVEGDGLEEGE